jgi:hypothetical protein
MDDQDQHHTPPNPSPQELVPPQIPAQPQQPQEDAAVPQLTTSAEDLAIINAPRSVRKLGIILVVIIVILVIGVYALINSVSNEKAPPPSKSTSSSSSNPANSPLTNNGSPSSDAKYCSNIINANLYC